MDPVVQLCWRWWRGWSRVCHNLLVFNLMTISCQHFSRCYPSLQLIPLFYCSKFERWMSSIVRQKTSWPCATVFLGMIVSATVSGSWVCGLVPYTIYMVGLLSMYPWSLQLWSNRLWTSRETIRKNPSGCSVPYRRYWRLLQHTLCHRQPAEAF